MDTRVTERQKRRKQRCLSRAYAQYCWCATLWVLACGCDLLKPTAARQTTPPPGAATAAQSNNPVAPPPPRLVRATASPADPIPQPHPAPLSPTAPSPIVTPRPAPALYSAPVDPPPKGAQLLLGSSAAAKAQTRHAVTNSVAKAPTPQSTVTYVPRDRGAAILIKGPPRQPEPRWSRKAAPLCLVLSAGALLVALVFRVKQRSPSGRKAQTEELILPREFKLKDSAIQPEVPFGMLAPAKPARLSGREVLFSALACVPNGIRYLAAKLPMEWVGASGRAVWQRISATLSPNPEQRSAPPLTPVTVPNSGEISGTRASQGAAAEKEAQGKPAGTLVCTNSGIPAGAPPKAPAPSTASKLG